MTVYMLHDAVDIVCRRELASFAAYGMVRVLDSGAMRGCVGIASWRRSVAGQPSSGYLIDACHNKVLWDMAIAPLQ